MFSPFVALIARQAIPTLLHPEQPLNGHRNARRNEFTPRYFGTTNERGFERDRVDLSGSTFHASKQQLPPLPILPFIRARRVLVLQSLSGTGGGQRELSAAGRSEREHPQDEGLLCSLGGVLPSGLDGDGFLLASPSAAGASVATGFAAIPKCRLVVWRVTGYWGAGHEQLSADDRHQPGQQPDEGVWMGRSDAKLQHLRTSQRARGERSLLESF